MLSSKTILTCLSVVFVMFITVVNLPIHARSIETVTKKVTFPCSPSPVGVAKGDIKDCITHQAEIPEPVLESDLELDIDKEPILTFDQDRLATNIANSNSNIDLEEARKVVHYTYILAEREKVDPLLFLAIIKVESAFSKFAKSSTGIGYSQVYPIYHQEKIDGRDLFDSYVNIEVGMSVLSNCMARNKTTERALACYNGAKTKRKAIDYIGKVNANLNYIKTLI